MSASTPPRLFNNQEERLHVFAGRVWSAKPTRAESEQSQWDFVRFSTLASVGGEETNQKKNVYFHAWIGVDQRASAGIQQCYHHRGPLEHTLFGPFPKLVLDCINADFYEQGRIFQHFSSSTFFPLHHSRFLWFFKTFAPFLQNSAQFLLIFDRDGRFCKFSSKFRRFFSEFRRISVVLTGVMPRLLDFRELANFFWKFAQISGKCENVWWDLHLFGPENFCYQK